MPYDASALEIEHLTGGASQNLLVVQDEPGRSLEWKTVRTMAFAVATPNRLPFYSPSAVFGHIVPSLKI